MSEKVELERFTFWPEMPTPSLTLPEGNLLQAFVASTSIGDLRLKVAMTLEQTLSLLRSLDFSLLHRLELRAKGFDSSKVDAILESLQRAKKLDPLNLIDTNITDEQKSRMNARGVSLR